MNAPSPETAARRSRRWRVPPPLTQSGELLEGAELLAELRGEVSVLLWKSLRNVTLWASATPRELPQLFAATAERQRRADLVAVGVGEPLLEPMLQIAALLGDAPGARREVVALACRRIAQWAEAEGAAATALAFTQAAALTCPGDAQLAYSVGRMARQRAEHARAESWYRRAIMLGRQSGDWSSYTLAYLGLGNLYYQRGNLPMARRTFIKGKRAADRKGLRELKGMALHSLAALAAEHGEVGTSLELASGALQAYGSRNPRVPGLAHDVACVWANQGEFRRALPVLRALLPRFSRHAERAVVLANIARSAGGAGERDAFRAAWDEALPLLDHPDTTGVAPQVLLHLSRGAASLAEWGRAEHAARRSLEAALATGQAQIQFAAEAVLDAARHRRHQAPPPAPAVASDAEAADSLVAELLASLDAPAAAG